LDTSAGRAKTGEPSQLTPRERDVIRGIIAGRRNREIAMDLDLSEQAIKNILSTIYAKCHVRNRLELALLAVRKNLLAH
jgi:two-component system nitrate/nitrite response regulator NarL